MTVSRQHLRSCIVASLIVLAAQSNLVAHDAIRFSTDIRPLLSANCFACHGPDEETRESGLRFDIREEAVDYGAIVPGDSDRSLLVERINTDDPDLIMPPLESGSSLNKEQRALLQQWIEEGAQYEVHWSYVPPVAVESPQVSDPTWPRSAIDHFVLARLEEAHLAPAEPETPHKLARRVALALTGLPPSEALVVSFVNAPSDQAYEQMVDTLLDSPSFGEHWASLWLDLVRYADTKGYEKDLPRDMWPYRDYIIRSLNADVPFDQFTLEQLAGDLLADETTDPDRANELKIASAMHRNTMSNDEGGTDNEEFRVLAVKDRVDTTMQVWMGLTAGCAKCHSHKFDPISQEEYYRLFAIFNQTSDADLKDDAPKLELLTEEQSSEIARLEARLAELRDSEAASESEQSSTKEADSSPRAENIKNLEQQLAELRKSVVAIPIMKQLDDGELRDTHVQIRGNFLELGEKIEPGTPAAFTSDETSEINDRLKFARWLVANENPLTARVMVNRVWARIFGRGLVVTEGDFGSQGTPPTHPELLDWLAVEFQSTHGWSLKKLCREIVLSATFRQSSSAGEEKRALDPTNELLARGPRYRLSAEMVRDQALAAAGLLSNKMYGPPVMPRQPDGMLMWSSPYNTRKWETSPGEDAYRRGLYTFWKRTSPYPSMMIFDSESREVCAPRRIRTNTPLQALVLMNDPVYVEAAGGLAERMMQLNHSDPSKSVQFGFRKLLIRPPNDNETEQLVQLYQEAASRFKHNLESAEELLKIARFSPVDKLSTPEQAAWVTVASVLLNLDEAITIQ